MRPTSFRKISFLFLATVTALLSHGYGSVTVTFQPAALSGGSKIISSWSEKDLYFTTPNGLVSNDISDSIYPYDGSTYASFFTGASPLSITTIDAQPFSLLSVDLAEYSTVFATPKTITFVGTYVGGGTTTATFTTDGIIDGNGPLQDFQTFQFPGSFTNLHSVTVNTDDYSMDNLVAIVPEPSVPALLSLFLVFPLMARRPMRSRAISSSRAGVVNLR